MGKMKAALLAKMAVNAKKAKDNLDAEMRKVQQKFADAAALENSRNEATLARSKKTRDIMMANKKEAADELAAAVHDQQRALDTLAKATNERIAQTNKHIAINAAQIKENAKKARQDLDEAMDNFDHKMRNVQEEAKKGRSKLAAQAVTQDKAFRAHATAEIKKITADTAAQFAKVRTKMADDRAAADAALAHTSSRLNAALSASKALQDKRFASTVSDIAEAKKEANDRVEGFKTSFKADVFALSEHVEAQSKALNARMNDLGGVVESNKLEQAKVNNAVNAELKRMVKIGNDRYQEHLKKDQELHDLMARNKEDTNAQITAMRDEFYSSLTSIKEQMAKDKAHAESSLSTATAGLYKTLEDNKMAQDAKNKELTDATHAAALDAKANLDEAKEMFASKISALDSTVKANAKKHEQKLEDLTGIVAANAEKDAQGREELRKISGANKKMLDSAVMDAIHKGEARALQVEEHVKPMNEKTRMDMNMRITTEISELSKHIHGQIDELTLETKEARMAMKREILEAVKDAEELAKSNLKKAVAWAEGEFSKLNSALATIEEKGEEERGKLQATITADKKAAEDRLNDAVAAQAAAVLSLQVSTHEEIKATNENLSSHAEQMKKDAETVRTEMEANRQAIDASLEAARESADAQLAAVDAASEARHGEVVQTVRDGIKAATERANKQFADAHAEMAKNREEVDNKLASDVAALNKAISTAAALEDVRFSKTVKNLAAARKEARDAVTHAKSRMTAEIAETISYAKKVESKIAGMVSVTSDMIETDRATQHTINKNVDGELKRILEKSNIAYSHNKAARGVIKKIMNENKAAAHEEVSNLAKEATETIKKTRSFQAKTLQGFKVDLTDATKKLYKEMADQDTAFQARQQELNEAQAGAIASTASSLASAKEDFKSRLESLTNAVTANKKAFTDNLEQATGVVMDWKAAADDDREAIRASMAAMNNDLENNIEDQIFQVIQEDRQKIADNYLSLKAYSAAAADKIEDYLAKGKGRNLASIGDLLESVAQLVDVETPPATGVGGGADSLPTIFSGDTVKIDNSVSKINGLVNEYISTLSDVKARWPLGLGKYLISKLELAMSKTGALEVDKIEAKSGNYVFVNAHAVGLSSKLSDFEGLAVKMSHYEKELSKLTTKLPNLKSSSKKANVNVPPPEWQGN